MDKLVSLPQLLKNGSLAITGSKSETNRLLLLQALYPQITLHNASDSDDSKVMRKALSGNDSTINVHDAGTAMRFLTAYFALQDGREVVLTGSQRMRERPIGILVDALRALGARIEYLENEGFPPIKITGKKLQGGSMSINATVSSQFITALLLIAPRLDRGLELILEGEVTSRPYIAMTLALLEQVGFSASFEGNRVTIQPQPDIGGQQRTVTVESDWSSASYYYSIVALADEGARITLSWYKHESLQGDSALAEIYSGLGVHTEFGNGTITLTRVRREASPVKRDLNATPDIAQTIAVTCLGLGIGCSLTGLHTLKIKETDRLAALRNELEKFGGKVSVTNNSLDLLPLTTPLNGNVKVATYNDHRMAMAFAPLAVKTPLIISDANVVSKSYPAFWSDLQQLGFSVNAL